MFFIHKVLLKNKIFFTQLLVHNVLKCCTYGFLTSVFNCNQGFIQDSKLEEEKWHGNNYGNQWVGVLFRVID